MEYLWIILVYSVCTFIVFLRNKAKSEVISSNNVIKGFLIVIIFCYTFFYLLRMLELNEEDVLKSNISLNGIQIITFVEVLISFIYWRIILNKYSTRVTTNSSRDTLLRYSREIENLISKGDIEKLMRFLKQDIIVNLGIQGEDRKTILLILSHFGKLKKKYIRGLINQEDYQVELNKLCDKLLKMIS